MQCHRNVGEPNYHRYRFGQGGCGKHRVTYGRQGCELEATHCPSHPSPIGRGTLGVEQSVEREVRREPASGGRDRDSIVDHKESLAKRWVGYLRVLQIFDPNDTEHLALPRQRDCSRYQLSWWLTTRRFGHCAPSRRTGRGRPSIYDHLNWSNVNIRFQG